MFDRIIVSTDDDEIAQTAKEYGAEIPFVRPAELADDHANTFDLLQHAALWVQHHAPAASLMCCLYATAPFVQLDDLVRGFKLLNESDDADYVYAITEFPFPIQRSIRKQHDFVRPCFPENMYKRSQDLETTYHDAGQFYWGRVAAFAEQRAFFADRSKGIELPRYRVVDIDTPEDWDVAEVQYQVLLASGKLL
ncbi:MAG: pseudaminic acid cytidylyltransferase [Reinekea sp.]